MNLRDLVAQGLPNAQIARQLGVHRSTVARRLHAQGLTNPPARIDFIQRRARIKHLRSAGLSVADIARTLGVSKRVVWGDLRRLTKANIGPRQTGKPA